MIDQVLSVVVPMYNEQKRISLLRVSLEEFFEQSKLPFTGYELILVNDGSEDKTSETLITLKEDLLKASERLKSNLTIKIIELPNNQGKGAALKAGVKLAQGHWILTMDADVATHPIELQNWHSENHLDLNDHNTIHIGSREHKDSKVTDKKIRRIMGRVFNLLVQTTSNLNIQDSQCGFKLYPGDQARKIFHELKTNGWAHDVELLMRANQDSVNIVEEPIKWSAVDDSRVNPAIDSMKMTLEVFKLRVSLIKEQLLGENSFWDRATLGVLGLAAFIICLTFPHYGSIWDEPVQHHYGRLVANWYASFFQDQRALNYSNLYLYGGFFEFWMGMIDKWFGWLPIYTVRHLCTALFGLFGVVGTIRLTRLLTNQPSVGFLAGVLLLLSPVFYGHMFINSKDIPFAVGYIWSIYYLVKTLNHLPKYSLGVTIKLGIAIGATLGIRIGGLILYSYLLAGISLMQILLIKQKKIEIKIAIKQTTKIWILVFGISYIIMLMFWPWAQVHPIDNPIQALSEMSKFAWNGPISLNGELVNSTNLPWSYIPHLMLVQNSEIFILGVLFFLVTLPWQTSTSKTRINIFIVLLSCFLPVGYIIIKKSVLYDNYRHVLFICPLLAMISAIGIQQISTSLKWRSKQLYYSYWIIVAGLCTLPIITMWLLHPNEYTYYNQFVGGPEKAFKKYESDYWGNSYRELFLKLEDKLVGEESGETFKVHAIGPAFQFIKSSEKSTILKYVRDPKDADFIAVVTRQNADLTVPGNFYVSVSRYDKVFSIVKDVRSVTKPKPNNP